MKKELITNKSNTLTEAKTGKLRLFDDKIINILYYLIENSEDDILKLNLLDVKKLLNIKTNDYIERILQSLERLDNTTILLRDITYQGRAIEWVSSSIIKEMILYKDSRSNVEIEISRRIIEGLKQKSNFTPLDINICNNFTSKYGLKIYELFKRYENFTTNHHLFQRDSESCFIMSIDDAIERFGVTYKYPSKWKEAFNRGINEIKEITSKDINILYIKNEKSFIFYWKRDDVNISLKMFKKNIRKNYINLPIIHEYTQRDSKKVLLSVNPTGKLYNKLDTNSISYENSKKLWDYLFKNQSKIIKYKG